MGVTYKAFDVDLHRPVTLKVISEQYLSDESARLRFLREARAAASVRHPNVASVFHLGRTGGSYFYAMEFVEGETLEKLIKRSGRLEVRLAMEIATQVAAGLAAVHEQNLVHRDIKPTNIMVRLKEERGVTVKIIDLGLAKTLDESASEAGISSPGAFVGTRGCFFGRGFYPADERADCAQRAGNCCTEEGTDPGREWWCGACGSLRDSGRETAGNKGYRRRQASRCRAGARLWRGYRGRARTRLRRSDPPGGAQWCRRAARHGGPWGKVLWRHP